MKHGKAFCPGHVTGFFEIHDSDPDPYKRGSRGGGFSTALGALTDAAVEPRERQKITAVVHTLDDYTGGEVTIRAIKNLIGNERLKVEVETGLQLPVSQGFGMSAAGALSSVLAVIAAAGEDYGWAREDAVKAAHAAEVEMRTGLGDVVAAEGGLFEIREEPGLPPHGRVRRWKDDAELVLCEIRQPMKTRDMLGDPEKRKRISLAGRFAVDRACNSRGITPEELCGISRDFATETGLMTPEVGAALKSIIGVGCGSMAMLGNSIFAFGPAGELAQALSAHGKIYVTSVDTLGARAL